MRKLKDIQGAKEDIKTMEWDDLANRLIDLEMYLLASNLNKNELKSIKSLILLYETEKKDRVQKNSKLPLSLEEQFVAYDWTNDLKD